MLSQSRRDEQAVTIATTLALFVAVTLVGVAALVLLERLSDPSNRAQNAVILAAEAAAIVVSGRYLLRHRRP
jgi:predicted permease